MLTVVNNTVPVWYVLFIDIPLTLLHCDVLVLKGILVYKINLKTHLQPLQMQIKHHSTIVKRYSECEGAYAHLSDDGYVYQKLIGHIAASGIYFTAK